MKKPPHVLEIFLQPGELWFGDENTRIRTLLGSCVAVTLWHPRKRIGGMCHYMLPTRGHGHAGELNGRYADEALAALLGEVRSARSQPHEYEAKLFGGGRMFHFVPPGVRQTVQIQERNVGAARELMAKHGFRVKAEHLGGHGHRQVIFDIWSGHVWMRHTPIRAPAHLALAVPAEVSPIDGRGV